MIDRDEPKERAKAAVDLAEWIRRDGVPLSGGPNEFKAKCPFHEDGTPSFTVFRKDGKWSFHCFGCTASGDIFEWVMRRKGIAFPEALKLVANAVNISLPTSGECLYQPSDARQAVKKPRGVFDPAQYRPLVAGGKVHAYLTGQRKLPATLLEDYRVGETTDGEAYSLAYKWRPVYWPANRDRALFEFCKVVRVDRPDGKKVEWRDPAGGKNILFGMESRQVKDAHISGGELVISEGEIDAMTWAAYGYAAVSVPGGAKYTGWIDICWEWLERFRKIHISFDEDAAGRLKLMEIVTRLGIARTDIVRLPKKDEVARFKDANECWQAGVTTEAIAACVSGAEVIKPDKLKGIYDFENAIWEKFHPQGVNQIGLTLPWGNHYGSSLPFRFRYAEVTVWTGYNKHGKSEVLNHCIIDLCWQGDKALVCSLEVQAAETYKKLIRMAQAKRDVCPLEERVQFRELCLKPLAQKIWVYDAVGNADIEDVLQVMLYAYQRFGVRQFVLDSLMRFSGLAGEGQEKWAAQKVFMDRLVTFAQTYNVHVHLVAHSKKPNDRKGEGIIPRRYDVSGSADITNLAFNVIVVWRNRAKQDKLEEIFQSLTDSWISKNPKESVPEWKRLLSGAPEKNQPEAFKNLWNTMISELEKLSPDKRAEFMDLVVQPDAYLIVDAQRGGDGDCPARHLWFHYDSLQFLEVSPWKSGDKRRLPVNYSSRGVVEMDEEF